MLKALSWSPADCHAVSQRVNGVTATASQTGEGTMYAVLRRLEEQGLVEARRRLLPTGYPGKVFMLTASGSEHLAEQIRSWREHSDRIAQALAADRPV